MRLTPGSRLGPYEVLSVLGTGGMGEVYRARDTRLGRDVAIKVLSDEIASDARALARFRTEARAVAALSHPNILALHDVGEADGIHYAVMELLDGETLRAVLEYGPLPVRRALEIASQLASALAAAHENGIVHRDVKPENVIVTRGEAAKLLDFGLAHQSVPSDPGDEGSPTEALTPRRAIVGTVAYMSPEQAQGLPVDHRSDQFSLGIVLFEMLAGRRPFQGASAPEVLTAIIREEPAPLEGSAPRVAPPVRWLVGRLLSKDPRQRYESTRDLALELGTWSLHLSDAGAPSGSASIAERGPGRWRALRLPAVAALAVVGVLAGAVATRALLQGTARTVSPVTRFEIRLPEGHLLSPHRQPFAISPSGELLVFSAFTWKTPFEERNQPQLFVRPLGEFEASPLPGTEGAFQPVFSPDGRHVAFSVDSGAATFLKRVPIAGGPVATICQCRAGFGVAWAPDGSILLGSESGPLQVVPASGGTPEPFTRLSASESEVSHRLPHLLPDGRSVLYTALRFTTVGMSWKTARIFLQSPGDAVRHLVVEGLSDGRWVAPGNLLLAREGRLFAAPFDPKALRASGTPVQVLDGVRHAIWTGGSWNETGAAMLDHAGPRLLAWAPGSVTPQYQFSLVTVDREGKETLLDLPRGPFLGGRFSPDARRVLVHYLYPGRQVEVVDLERGARREVTFGMNPLWAIWGPGPDRMTFTSDHEGPIRIYSRRLGAGPEEVETLLSEAGGEYVGLGSWTRDGKTLAFVVQAEKTGYDIWLLEPGKVPHPFVATRFSESHPDVSPDGRWLLYTSDDPGRPEVFVRPLSGEGSPVQVSVRGGFAPLWSRDGSTILYWALEPPPTDVPGVLLRVRATPEGQGLSLGQPERFLEAPRLASNPGHGWDVAPDGRILTIRKGGDAERRAWRAMFYTDRIRVDLGGLPARLVEAGRRR